jgi:hypothetical protein
VNLTDENRLAILDEIIAVTERPKRKPYQFTRREYAERKGVTLMKAQGSLERAVGEGVLLRDEAFIDGKKCWVYWREEDEPEGSHD